MPGPHILIVDDHPLFAGGFLHMARTLRPDWILRDACSAAAALHHVANAVPDLALVDIGLPDADGFCLLPLLAEAAPGLPVILISGRDDPATRIRARAAGAAGFIGKRAAPETTIDAIDTVLAGGFAFGDDETASLPVLTLRQAEVLALLAEGHANKEIRHRLGIAERTVRAHLTELFQLLGAHSRMQAVIRGRELGLIG